MLNQITPLILSLNEEANISRALDALKWADRVIVIDSFSQDATEAICAGYANVDFIQRKFDQHAKQWNFGLQQNIETKWVLALDADHIVSKELLSEIEQLKPAAKTHGYWASFSYVVAGGVLKQSLYPPLVSLFRSNKAHYIQDGHTQRLQVTGKVDVLQGKIFHDDRKHPRRWLKSQWNYALLEASKLNTQTWNELSLADQMRKLGLTPLLVLPYTLFAKGLILSGWPGLVYSAQRLIAELALQLARLKSLFKF